MKCLRLLCMCFVICFCLSITCSAEESDDPPVEQLLDELPAAASSADDFPLDNQSDDESASSDVTVYNEDNPLPVVIVDADEPSYFVSSYGVGDPVVVIGDQPPDDPLFYGSGWITGTDANLGTVTIYFPINYKSGYLGIDRNGYLFNVSATTLSGYLSGVYNNSLSCSSFSYPRYRSSSSSSYLELRLIPENSNMEIATANMPKYGPDDFVPYILVFMLGVVIVCFMKRS